MSAPTPEPSKPDEKDSDLEPQASASTDVLHSYDEVGIAVPAPASSYTGALPNSVIATPDPDEQESGSQISAAGLVGSTLAGGIDLGKDHVDRFGRQTAANILTAGNADRLPAPGFTNRAGLANTLTDPRMNASTALDATPFSANARSTQVLDSTLNQTNALGRFSGVVGTVAGPAMGMYEGYVDAPEDATTGERVANALGGGIKEVDDGIVSGGAGAVAASLTVTGGVAISSGGVTLPAGAAVVASAPVVATGASIAASNRYDGSPLDTSFDNWVDNTLEPAVASAIDTTIGAYESTKSLAEKAVNSAKSWLK